jgi:hypothetical protein
MDFQATTGLTEEQWEELAVLVSDQIPPAPAASRPAALPPVQRVRLTLEHLRTNVPQQVLAEHYAVSQPTVSRTIAATLPLIDKALEGWDNGLAEITTNESLLVDGTLIPTGRRAKIERLYNGKHKTHGVNVQVVCTLDAAPILATPPMPGADHDITCFRAHKLDELFATRTGLADSGYQGHDTFGLIVPDKKPIGGELSEDRLANNRTHAALRAPVERVNAWLKSFKILSTRYRRTWNDLELTIRCVFRILRYRHFISPQERSYE